MTHCSATAGKSRILSQARVVFAQFFFRETLMLMLTTIYISENTLEMQQSPFS